MKDGLHRVGAAVTMVNSAGGGYAESTVTDYLAASHFPVVLLGLCMGLLGVVGLLCLLSYLRELMGTGAEEQQLGSVFSGTDVASAIPVLEALNNTAPGEPHGL